MIFPFENDTDAIVKKLAKRSLQSEKQRNIFIMITIAFASCLIMSLSLYVFGGSYQTRKFYQGRLQGTVLGYILCQVFGQVGVFGKLHYTFPLLSVLIF